jgi:hypothetical protein
MKTTLYYLSIAVLILFTQMSCGNMNSTPLQNIPFGNGAYFITNDSYDYDSYHNDIRSKGLRSKDTYIRIEGAIDIQPDRLKPESIHRYGDFATIEVKSANDKNFNVHNESFNASPQGTIFINKDSTVNFYISGISNNSVWNDKEVVFFRYEALKTEFSWAK